MRTRADSRNTPRPRGVRSVCCAAVLTVIACLGCSERPGTPEGPPPAGHTRKAVAAGLFYEGSASRLRGVLRDLLEKAAPSVPQHLEGRCPRALIVPHAGYVYSGETAACAYKLLEGCPRPSRVLLLGPSHYVRLPEAFSVPPFRHYETPLGQVPVDRAAREAMLRLPGCVSEEAAHVHEHCLEVQLPFLQALWEEPPRILPVIVGELRDEARERLAEALARLADERTLIVASSDFTHYGPRYLFTPFGEARGKELGARIRDLDHGAIERIRDLDAAGLLDYCDRTGATICGRQAIAVLLDVLSRLERVEAVPLCYASSGEATGEYVNSVSYHAHAFYELEPEHQD